jgi:hypothetical protein
LFCDKDQVKLAAPSFRRNERVPLRGAHAHCSVAGVAILTMLIWRD